MQYQVTGYYWESPGKALNVSGNIDAKRFEKVELAKNVCLLALGLEEKLQLVVDNYIEWETELLARSQSSILWQQLDKFESMQHRLGLARKLTNVLTGFRLYLDQTDHALSKIFGNPSDELQLIKQFKNSLYDSCFGYRFLEALRNHVQHCDLPVETVTYHSKLVDREKTPQVQFAIIPKASLAALSENNDFKKSILEELKSGPEKIDLRPHIREYISCLTRLHKEIKKVFSSVEDKNRNYYQDAIKEYSVFEDKTVLSPRFVMLNDSGVTARTVELYEGFLEVYDTLKKRNANIGDISKHFASNSIYS